MPSASVLILLVMPLSRPPSALLRKKDPLSARPNSTIFFNSYTNKTFFHHLFSATIRSVRLYLEDRTTSIPPLSGNLIHLHLRNAGRSALSPFISQRHHPSPRSLPLTLGRFHTTASPFPLTPAIESTCPYKGHTALLSSVSLPSFSQVPVLPSLTCRSQVSHPTPCPDLAPLSYFKNRICGR